MATITIQFNDGRTKTLSTRELRNATRWTALLCVVVLIGVAVPVRQIIYARNAAALRPTMERIANHGGAAADMWLAFHYGELWRLPAAAAAGYPQAQYLQGRLLIYHGHRHAGQRLLRLSAAAGYPCAVAREELHLKNLDSFSCR